MPNPSSWETPTPWSELVSFDFLFSTSSSSSSFFLSKKNSQKKFVLDQDFRIGRLAKKFKDGGDLLPAGLFGKARFRQLLRKREERDDPQKLRLWILFQREVLCPLLKPRDSLGNVCRQS